MLSINLGSHSTLHQGFRSNNICAQIDLFEDHSINFQLIFQS